MECNICFDETNEKIFYQDNKDSEWKECPYCLECINEMKQKQWNIYVNSIKTETCKATLTRLIKLGPPTKIRDTYLPCDNETGEVHQFKVGNEIMDSKIIGYYIGEEMTNYKKFLSKYLSELD